MINNNINNREDNKSRKFYIWSCSRNSIESMNGSFCALPLYQVLKHDLGTLSWSAGKRTNDNLNREFKLYF